MSKMIILDDALVEAVARAICTANGENPDYQSIYRGGLDQSTPLQPRYRHYWRQAKAAIAAGHEFHSAD